jgi:hypothetical protein
MELARVLNGKKFMWDGRTYTDEKERGEMAQEYEDDGFEVELVEEGDEYFLFTRRVVTEIVVEGEPPI